MSGINVEFGWTTDGIRSEISARFDSVDQALAFRDALDRSIANAEAAVTWAHVDEEAAWPRHGASPAAS